MVIAAKMMEMYGMNTLSVNTTAVILALAVTVFTMRSRRWPARVSDFLAVAPDTVPGILLAIGFILLWNSPKLPFTPYGSQLILVMAFTVLFVPMAVQNIKTSAAAMSPTLSEASAVAGATSWQTFTRVTLPMLAPWIMNQFEQGHRAEAMAMTLIGVGTSTAVLVLIRWWQGRSSAHVR